MIPMMVPQDAVSSFAAGFPTGHNYAGSFPSRWIAMASHAHPGTAVHPQIQSFAGINSVAATPSQPSQPSASGHVAQLSTTPGVPTYPNFQATFPHYVQAQNFTATNPQLMQPSPYSGHPDVMPQPMSGVQSNSQTSELAMSSASNQSVTTQMTAPAQAPSSATGAVQTYPSHFSAAPVSTHPPASDSIYPQNLAAAVSTPVAFGLHTHMQNHSIPSASQHNSNQLQSPQASDPSSHQGGGGNLAHCA